MTERRNLELMDLTALCEAVAGDDTFAPLVRAVRQASSMSSVRNDMRRATEMLRACKTLQGKALESEQAGDDVQREEAATIQALFMQAVLWYARATHSKGKGRNKLQILNQISDEGRVRHERITVLRDTYLAHFDDLKDWEAHRVVLALDLGAPAMALSYPHQSYYVRSEDGEVFDRLLVEAVEIAEQAYQTASSRLNLILNAHFDADPIFLDRLRGRQFAPESFFPPDEIVAYVDSIGRMDADPHTSPKIETHR